MQVQKNTVRKPVFFLCVGFLCERENLFEKRFFSLALSLPKNFYSRKRIRLCRVRLRE